MATFFEGGPLNLIGITPSFISSLGTQTAQSGAILGLGQIWQGAGQSFAGSAGQSLAGNLAGSAVNIALNGLLGTSVPGPAGLKLNSGANVLASTITPYITGATAAAINQNIQQSLKSAGPFGAALSTLGTGLVNQTFNGLTNTISSSTLKGATGPNYKSFPGAGNEPPADYGGNSYTIGPSGSDVVFSIQPANQGPQAFGVSQAVNFPKSFTTLPFNQLSSMPLLSGNSTINTLKKASMNGLIGQKAMSSSFNPSAFSFQSLR